MSNVLLNDFLSTHSCTRGHSRVVDQKDPYGFETPGSGSAISNKKVRNSSFWCFVTYNDFLSLMNDVNVPLKSKRQKKEGNINYFLLTSWKPSAERAGSGSVTQWYRSADPDLDPYQNVTDPQHWYILSTRGFTFFFSNFKKNQPDFDKYWKNEFYF